MIQEPPPKTRGARVYKRVPLETRFWAKVDKSAGENACWPWRGAIASNGYGSMTTYAKREAAHRLAWMFTNGAIPKKLDICHRCDFRACCNPKHLFLGTRKDNMRDASGKGRLLQQKHPERAPRGSSHGCAKLNESIVIEIHRRHAAGESLGELAARFAVTKTTISNILKRRFWKHVEIPNAL